MYFPWSVTVKKSFILELRNFSFQRHVEGRKQLKQYMQLFKAYWLCDAPTGLTLNNVTLCPHCFYVFCIYLRTNSDLCHLKHKLIGFYNRDGKCLLRGTNWVFK